MTLEAPPSTICPTLTIEQARRLSALKREGHNVVAYESLTGDRLSAVVFVTSRTEFAIDTDGNTLDTSALEADGSLPPSPARRRRRSLRNPAGSATEEQ